MLAAWAVAMRGISVEFSQWLYREMNDWCGVAFASIVVCLSVLLLLLLIQRRRQQVREEARVRSGPAEIARAKQLWRLLRFVVRLTATAAAASSCVESNVLHHPSPAETEGTSGSWHTAWERVSSARADRKRWSAVRKGSGARPRGWLATTLVRWIGRTLVALMALLIAFGTHAHFVVALPWLGLRPAANAAAVAFSAWLAVRVFVDFARVACMDPGRPEATATSNGGSAASGFGNTGAVFLELGISRAEPSECPVRLQWCATCRCPMPPRCHHCDVCGRCVLRMDHHCPFVNNCIGLRNLRSLILLLLELVVGCSMILVCLLPQMIVALRMHDRQLGLTRRIHVIVVFATAMIADSLLGPFLWFHIQLVLANQTTMAHMKQDAEYNRRLFRRFRERRLAELREKKRLVDRENGGSASGVSGSGDALIASSTVVRSAAVVGPAPEQTIVIGDVDPSASSSPSKEEADATAFVASATAKRRSAGAAASASSGGAGVSLKEERHCYSRGVLQNFSDVFGAPPPWCRRRVEAVLEWISGSMDRSRL